MSELAERLMMLTAGKAIQMDAARGGGEPEWTPQDAAQACGGLDQRRYAAFAYRWACDRSLASALYGCLLNASMELAERERWPKRTKGDERYLDRLVRLAILEEDHPPSLILARMSAKEREQLFGQDCEAIAEMLRDNLASRLRPMLLAHMAGFHVHVWTRELAKPYQGIRDILDSWCHDARRHVMRRVTGLTAEQESV